MSLSLRFASGALLATIAFEMVPRGLELGSLPIVVPGFIVGLAAVYALDLFVHRGQMAGEHSEKRRKVERYTRQRPRGNEVTVLAGGTTAEGSIEELSIGAVSAAPSLRSFAQSIKVARISRI
jgi:zinc transporter, ZIP family